jgi:hypothetical protein
MQISGICQRMALCGTKQATPRGGLHARSGTKSDNDSLTCADTRYVIDDRISDMEWKAKETREIRSASEPWASRRWITAIFPLLGRSYSICLRIILARGRSHGRWAFILIRLELSDDHYRIAIVSFYRESLRSITTQTVQFAYNDNFQYRFTAVSFKHQEA